MRTYETTFIINPQTDDATIDKYVKEVADLITESDGTILHQENMGTRRLAYEINGLAQGFYANFVYQAPQSFLPKLKRHFKLNEVYIRDLTIRFEGNPEEIFKKKDLTDRKQYEKPNNASNVNVKAKETKIEASTEETKMEASTEETPTEAPKPEAEVEPAAAEEAAPVESTETEKPAENSSDNNEL